MNALNMFIPTEIVNYEFDTKDLICLVISSVVGVWYILKKVVLDFSLMNCYSNYFISWTLMDCRFNNCLD